MILFATTTTSKWKELKRLRLISARNIFFLVAELVVSLVTSGSSRSVGRYKDAMVMRRTSRTSLIIRAIMMIINELLWVHIHCSYCRSSRCCCSTTSGVVYEVGEIRKRRQLHHLPRGILLYRQGISSLLLLELVQFFPIELDPSIRPALCSCFY